MAAIVFNALGIVGICCFLIAYFLLQNNKLSPHGLGYLSLNLLGAVMVMISLVYDWNLPAFLLEAAWAMISIYGILRYFRKKPA